MPIAQQVLSLETMAYSVARDPRARIRITGNMSFAAQTLDAIAHVRELHPDLDVEFVIKSFAHRMDAVASGDADIALIRGGVDRPPGLEPLDLGVEDLLVVMSSRHPPWPASKASTSMIWPHTPPCSCRRAKARCSFTRWSRTRSAR